MSKTIEEIFLETKAVFQAQAEEAAKAAMDKIYDEYLPYVGDDTDSNVYFKASSIVRRFFDDTLREDEVPHDFFREYTGAMAREKLVKEFPEQLQNKVIADLQREVEMLRGQLNNYRRY